MAWSAFPYLNYPISIEPSRTATKRYLSAVFGDGYEQTAPDGINTDISTFTVSWNYLDKAASQVIYNFLYDRMNITPFMFKQPDWPAEIQVKCVSLSMATPQDNIYTINAEFKRDYTVGTN